MKDSDRGLYIAVFELPAGLRIRVGRLGRFTFRSGFYLYVGSAQRNRSARIARHALAQKPLRWHIDYLSSQARMLGAIEIAGPRRRECQIGRELAGITRLVVPGFGASDCRCPGHLFYMSELPPDPGPDA